MFPVGDPNVSQLNYRFEMTFKRQDGVVCKMAASRYLLDWLTRRHVCACAGMYLPAYCIHNENLIDLSIPAFVESGSFYTQAKSVLRH